MLPVYYITESSLKVSVIDENTNVEMDVSGSLLNNQARRVIAPFAHSIDILTEFDDQVGGSTFTGKTFAVSDAGAAVGFVRPQTSGSSYHRTVGAFIMETASFIVPWTFTVETVSAEQRIVVYYLNIEQPHPDFPSSQITFEGLSDNPALVNGDGELDRAVENMALPGTDGTDFILVNNNGIITALVGENEVDQGTNFAAPVSLFRKNLYQT